MAVTVVVICVVLTLAVIAWFFLNRHNPEDAASHGTPAKPPSDDRVGDDRV
jgi:hypothetical protein